jgi:hypothetical protein
MGSSGRSLEQLRLQRQLLAIDQGQFRQINSQLGSSAAVPAFLYERDASGLRLAASRHNPAIHSHGLFEFATETIADHVPIG